MAEIMSTHHRLHTIRGALDRLEQRISETEQRITDLAHRVDELRKETR